MGGRTARAKGARSPRRGEDVAPKIRPSITIDLSYPLKDGGVYQARPTFTDVGDAIAWLDGAVPQSMRVKRAK